MYMIVGLGNPGREYEKTRHNAGFDALDLLIEEAQTGLPKTQFRALCGKGRIGAESVLFVKPLTYMNESGTAVRALCDYYKVDPEKELIVLVDDVALHPGSVRIRSGGSDGGHNGLKSLIAHLKTDRFVRIRIGVGEKPQGWDLADHVLSKMPPEERKAAEEAMKIAAEAAKLIVTEGVEQAMNRCNVTVHHV